ncbi:DUF4870 domain-containing protein [Demequina sp. SYSU T00192]|uniref:DUF4870 domain-containing protein n=1 Tax=Demequina litoralis TaxID=3051660 RepID=A0ABT8GBI9_9MICO|nr:DUF4870 domain-containing protein [Demequina sp. SYSU T00192]MDN4476504.1 DUF4870 domain-containing protein [Demequina sp. SYSU T00192]
MTENPPPPPQSPPPPPQQPYAPQPMTQSDERLWAMLAHLGIILFGFLPPLIIWLVFRERSAFVDDQGKEALNFSILVTIAQIVAGILWVVIIGIVLSVVVGIAMLVLCIMAGIAANRGERYRYPFNWRIVK